MNEIDKIELASALRKLGDNTAIIFISSNRELALHGYEVAARRYLSKPLQPEALREALLHCCRTLEKMEILLPTGKGQRRLAPSELVYAEAVEHVTKLFLVIYALSDLFIRFFSKEVEALRAFSIEEGLCLC